jgi:hypothetical protein
MPRRNTAVTTAGGAGAIALAFLCLLAAAALGAADARPLPTASHVAAGGASSSSSSLASVGAHYRRRRALLQDKQQQEQQPDEASGYALGADSSSSPNGPTATNDNQREDVFFAGTAIDPSTNKVTAGGRASAVLGPAHIPAKPSRGLLEDGDEEEEALASGYALGPAPEAPEEKEKAARREDMEFAEMKTDMDAKEVKAGQADAVASWRSGGKKSGRRLLL